MSMEIRKRPADCTGGFVLVAVLFLMALLSALMGSYMMLTRLNLKTAAASKDQIGSYYAAEAAVNLRAAQLKVELQNGAMPAGSTPEEGCIEGSAGSGAFACQTISLGPVHSAVSYVKEESDNPMLTRIPPGEVYEGLEALEYRYTITGRGKNRAGETGAVLEMDVRNRLIPLFQFAVFYDKDLEIVPREEMTLVGPVHSNGDIYLDAEDHLTIDGQVTVAGSFVHGTKDENECSGALAIVDPIVPQEAPECDSSRHIFSPEELAEWNGNVRAGVSRIVVPDELFTAPFSSSPYWQRAELRLVLYLDAAGRPDTSISDSGVAVAAAGGDVDEAATEALHGCRGTLFESAEGAKDGPVAAAHRSMYNAREGTDIQLLEADLAGLLDCIAGNREVIGTRRLDDESDGGLVLYFTVSGPDSEGINAYGIRVRNAASLQSTRPSAKKVQGLTLVSDQALYTVGDFNTVERIPAAMIADVYYALSGAWQDSSSRSDLESRAASDTTINAAIVAGTDTTGELEGDAGRDRGAFSGGLHDFVRLLEAWRACGECEARQLTVEGSFVSLNTPRHSQGRVSEAHFSPPAWRLAFDASFQNRAGLPPLTPDVVIIRQERFTRLFD